jgi:drug/metabolite transporter (DMT)-like permease
VSNRRLVGVLLVALSAASFGVMPILTKIAYRDGSSTLGVLSVRFAVAGAVLLVLAALAKQRLPRGRKLLAVAALGGVGYVGESACYFLALQRTSAGLTALLLYVYPALVVLLAAAVARRAPDRFTLGLVALALAGTALTIGRPGGGALLGVALGLAAAATYSIYIVVSAHVVSGLAPLAVSGVVMAAAGLVDGTAALVVRPALPQHAHGWAAVVGVALVGSVVAVWAFFEGLRRLGPSDTAVVSTLEPVVSVVLGAVVLGEAFGGLQVVGGVLVLAAVVALARHGAGTGEPAV